MTYLLRLFLITNNVFLTYLNDVIGMWHFHVIFTSHWRYVLVINDVTFDENLTINRRHHICWVLPILYCIHVFTHHDLLRLYILIVWVGPWWDWAEWNRNSRELQRTKKLYCSLLQDSGTTATDLCKLSARKKEQRQRSCIASENMFDMAVVAESAKTKWYKNNL